MFQLFIWYQNYTMKLTNFLLSILLTHFLNFSNAYGYLMENVLFNKKSEDIFFEKVIHGDISTVCSTAIIGYYNSLKTEKYWAYKMYDSGGKIPSGLLSGNTYELGDFDQCLSIYPGKDDNSQDIYGKYCIGILKSIDLIEFFNKSYEIEKIKQFTLKNRNRKLIQLAVCVPNVCKAQDLINMHERLGIRMIFEDKSCQVASDLHPQFDYRFIVAVILILIPLVFTVFATFWDIFLKKFDVPLFRSFSAFKNVKSLVSSSNDQFSCLYGLRVLNTFIIVMDHKYFIQSLRIPIKNTFYQFNYFKDPAFFIFLSGVVTVDTFFLISSFLVTYSYLKNGDAFNIFLYFVNRLVRLMPNILYVIIFYVSLSKYLGSGPIWPTVIQKDIIETCEQNWWRTVLFIQNFWEPNKMCLITSWYLAVDTQLYILTPLFLIFLTKKPKLAIKSFCFLTILTIIISFIIAWVFEMKAFMDLYAQDSIGKVNFFLYLHFRIYSKGAPWFTGIVLGYCIFKSDKKVNLIGKKTNYFLWILAFATILGCLFGGQNLVLEEYNKLHHSLYLAFIKLFWSLANSWIIYGCACGYGPSINAFLGAPIFQFLGKLNYSIFMCHMIVLTVIYAQIRTVKLFTHTGAWYTVWSDYTLVILLSLVLYLCVEIPFANLKDVLLKKYLKNKKKT